MGSNKQVFETSSRLRWKTFQWFSRILIFFLLLTIPIAWIAYKLHTDPQFVSLSSKKHTKSSEKNVKELTEKEIKKYGIDAYLRSKFLKARQKNALLMAQEKRKPVTQRIRAGYYVDWDPQAFSSLQSHIADMNMVIPEWFFIDSSSGKIISEI